MTPCNTGCGKQEPPLTTILLCSVHSCSSCYHSQPCASPIRTLDRLPPLSDQSGTAVTATAPHSAVPGQEERLGPCLPAGPPHRTAAPGLAPAPCPRPCCSFLPFLPHDPRPDRGPSAAGAPASAPPAAGAPLPGNAAPRPGGGGRAGRRGEGGRLGPRLA